MIRILCLSLALLAAAAPVKAESGAPALVEDRRLMTECLCHEVEYEALNTALQTQRSLYDDARGRSDALGHELDSARAGLQTSDSAAVAAFREKSAAKQALDADIRELLAPRFNQAVGRYNDAVAGYDRQCRGLTYNATILAEVKTGLVCTAPIPDGTN